jgi:hypothetical protein
LPAACLGLAPLLFACGTWPEARSGAPPDPRAFEAYWYRGQAELTRYRLEQSRYGRTHEGDAVLVFVTEDFLPDVQVKFEGRGSGTGRRSVLKLNLTRNFVTGIYPYSLMTSVFTPVDGSPTLKVSSSAQEWCGHTYTQLNHRRGGYLGLLHSYFQDEADGEFALGEAWLEDEIWTRIRLAPDSLPVGEIEIVPGLQQARLAHRPSRIERAVGTLVPEDGGRLRRYRLEYAESGRVLEIRFETAFPHVIVGWEERDGDAPVTRAERTHGVQLDYWNRNSPEDVRERGRLGLD